MFGKKFMGDPEDYLDRYVRAIVKNKKCNFNSKMSLAALSKYFKYACQYNSHKNLGEILDLMDISREKRTNEIWQEIFDGLYDLVDAANLKMFRLAAPYFEAVHNNDCETQHSLDELWYGLLRRAKEAALDRWGRRGYTASLKIEECIYDSFHRKGCNFLSHSLAQVSYDEAKHQTNMVYEVKYPVTSQVDSDLKIRDYYLLFEFHHGITTTPQISESIVVYLADKEGNRISKYQLMLGRQGMTELMRDNKLFFMP